MKTAAGRQSKSVTWLRVEFSFTQSKQRGYFVGLDALRVFLNAKISSFSSVLLKQNNLDTDLASGVIPDKLC